MAQEKTSTREAKKKPKPARTPAKMAAAPVEAAPEKAEPVVTAAPVTAPPPKQIEKEPIAVATAQPQPQPKPQTMAAPVTSSTKVAPFKTGDDYTVLVHYDKITRLFVGEVAEFPKLMASGISREEVVREITIKLEDYIEDIRHQVSQLPEPIYSRQYPEKIEINISQSLFRKLDLLSRQEKIALEKLVSELLASSIERRFGGSPGEKKFQPQQPQSNQGGQQQGGGHHRHGGGGHGGHRHGGGGGRGGRHQGGGGGGGVDSRENFLEYVRSLEKGGGNWRKK